MLLAVAGGLAVGLLGAREATATPLDCETDAVPFVYKGWYNDNGYVWVQNNSGKPVAVQVQGDQGPTPIAAGQVQSWPRACLQRGSARTGVNPPSVDGTL